MTKYDMTAIRYLEHGFLPLARNRKSYICPNCGSGSGKKWFRHDFQGWGVLEMLELRTVSKQSRTIPNSKFFKL